MSETAETLIRDLAECGVRLTRRADRLRVEAAPGTVTPELRMILSERKTELLAALSADPGRDRLLRLAEVAVIGADLVQAIPAADVAECAGLSDLALRAYLHSLRDADLRKLGKRPSEETATAMCRSCGPIWLAPEVASVSPIVNGWPRVLGCPWCHVIDRRAIPRPPVACGRCQHFERDRVNPAGGMGRCAVGRATLATEPLPFPTATRQCARHEPEAAA